MTQVDFYHLTRDPIAMALPAIARRVLETGARLLVVAGGREQLEALSEGLWNAGADSYLAHDFADAPLPEAQPILLSHEVKPLNSARFIALADGIWRDEALEFERAFHFFDETNINDARAAWRALGQNEEAERRYWKQDGGRWRQGPG